VKVGEQPDFDQFVEIITVELARRGHLRCEKCNATLRKHVLVTLLRGGRRLNHKFAHVGE
jgi:hypothetical protein